MLAEVVAELGVERVGVGKEDIGEGGGRVESIGIDEDLEILEHGVEIGGEEVPVVVGAGNPSWLRSSRGVRLHGCFGWRGKESGTGSCCCGCEVSVWEWNGV